MVTLEKISESKGTKIMTLCGKWFLENGIALFEAIGTVGATIVALWLARKDNQRRIDGMFVWNATTEYQPILLVRNISKRISVIKSIEMRYLKTTICSINISEHFDVSKFAILHPNKCFEIPICKYMQMPKPPKTEKNKYRLKVAIRQWNGRRYSFSTRLSYEEFQTRFFGQKLFENDAKKKRKEYRLLQRK